MDLDYCRSKLEAEKAELEADLAKIGRRNPQNKTDWETKPFENTDFAFRDEVADQMEDMEERQATEIALEQRLNHVNLALKKIKDGTYGRCEIGGEMIEADRLNANPAARTCKVHLNEET